MTHRKIGWIFIALFSLVSIGALGQLAESKEGGKLKFPRWVSDKGYWVVESNINSPYGSYHQVLQYRQCAGI